MKARSTRGLGVAVLCVVLAMPSVAAAQGSKKATHFSWFSNASVSSQQAAAQARTRNAIRKARGLNQSATWVCSPAGFGQGSRCAKG